MEHAVRAGWPSSFPDVVIHCDERLVKFHPCYTAAKQGDAHSALALVNDTFDPSRLATILAWQRSTQPVVVSVHAQEESGRNAIPEVMAEKIAVALNWRLDKEIVQANVVNHTGASGFARMARQALFAGEVIAGADYLIVDDFIGQGGTIANLRGHILRRGGHVIGATTLTGKDYSAKLSLTISQLTELRGKHGGIESWWKEQFGFNFDKLTESEARYLIRTSDALTVRDRIAASKQA